MTIIRLTGHAKIRRKQMGVTEDEVAAAVTDPDTRYPAPGGANCHQRGRLVAVVNDRGQVITLLWHRAEGR